jgi:3-hydroxyacyl-CoA dehydrogenase
MDARVAKRKLDDLLKYIPGLLLCRMVNAGYLGRKSGKGFYYYS